MYDHSNVEETKFALKGFLNGSAMHYTQEERKEKVLKQLAHYFGEEAKKIISYHDKIWNDQTIQPNDNGSFLPPHYNNGHAVFRKSYMENKLYFTGTETSPVFSGYMDGAVVAAKMVATNVLQAIKNDPLQKA
jgi:monoamine oxidase